MPVNQQSLIQNTSGQLKPISATEVRNDGLLNPPQKAAFILIQAQGGTGQISFVDDQYFNVSMNETVQYSGDGSKIKIMLGDATHFVVAYFEYSVSEIVAL